MDLEQNRAAWRAKSQVVLAAQYQLECKLSRVAADLRCQAVLTCTGEPVDRQAARHGS